MVSFLLMPDYKGAGNLNGRTNGSSDYLTNNKPPKKYSLFISIILDFADLGHLHTLGGNASFHKGQNCSIEYEVETPYRPLHIPRQKVLAKMINLSHEEGLCHIMDGRKSNNRRIQKSLMLPLAFFCDKN